MKVKNVVIAGGLGWLLWKLFHKDETPDDNKTADCDTSLSGTRKRKKRKTSKRKK